MANSEFRLIGLNGLNAGMSAEASKPCFVLGDTNLKPINIKEAFAHPEGDYICAIFNIKSPITNDWTWRNKPEILAYAGGGVFTDDYGNTIYINYRGNNLSDTMYQAGYFGVTPGDFERGAHGRCIQDFGGADLGQIVKSQFIGGGIYTDPNSAFNKFYLPLIGNNLGKKKSFPLLFDFYRTKAYGSGVFSWLSSGLSALSSILPSPINIALSALSSAVSGDKTPDLLNKYGSNIVGSLARESDKVTGRTIADGEINAGIDAAKSLENVDLNGLTSKLGIDIGISGLSANQAEIAAIINRFDKLLMQNDINTLIKAGSKLKIDHLNNVAAAYRKARLARSLCNPINANGLKGLGGLGAITTAKTIAQKIQESSKLQDIPEFNQIYLTTMGRGYSGALPFNVVQGGKMNALLPQILKKHGNNISAAERNAYMNMSLGVPPAQNTFHEKALIAIENDIRQSTTPGVRGLSKLSAAASGDFFYILPSDLPLETRKCFAKELATKGITLLAGTPAQVEAEKKLGPKESVAEFFDKETTEAQKYYNRKEFR